MHKQLLFEFKEKEAYFIKNDNNENLGHELKLYCYKSDDNNIYLDKPIIDYPENYSLITPNGEKISVKTLLKEKGYYNNYFAIISKHKNITSIENFFIEECNSFYSIEIKKDVRNLLEAIGLENVKVNEKLFDYNLINLKNNANGYELLFFISSEKEYVNNILNEYKMKIIKQHIDACVEDYCEKGISVLSQDGKSIYPILYNIKNKIKLYEDNDINTIKFLENNCKFIRKYADVLYRRIKMLLNEDTKISYLYFGYTDEWIVEVLINEILQ